MFNKAQTNFQPSMNSIGFLVVVFTIVSQSHQEATIPWWQELEDGTLSVYTDFLNQILWFPTV